MAWNGEEYQDRFDALAASGEDVHGEADLVMAFGPRTVLDAGCGTGRVARELHRRGVQVTGVDADPSMIAAARRRDPALDWHLADLERLSLHQTFDVVVMAGNVPLFTPEGTQRRLVAGCARHVEHGGLLVSGFQLGRGYDLDAFDEDCTLAGLTLADRWATWSRDPFPGDGSYAVSLHRRPARDKAPRDDLDHDAA
jgi:SAM-dependent methyltransferase